MGVIDYLLSVGFTDVGSDTFRANVPMPTAVVINGVPQPQIVQVDVQYLGGGAVDGDFIEGYSVIIGEDNRIDIWDSPDVPPEKMFEGILPQFVRR